MQPDNNRPVTVPPRNVSSSGARPDRDLAVSLMREQIDKLYDGGATSQPQTSQPLADETAYDKTHDNTAGPQVNAEQWQHYHTAWQQYYQQYYERYYLAQNHARHISAAAAVPQQVATVTAEPAMHVDESLTPDKAIDDIRHDLRAKIKHHAGRVRKSRHFIPVISALVVMSVFVFLQYNRLIVAQVKSYVSPGSISAQNIIVDAELTAKVSPEPRIIIPKINVDAPVVYGLTTLAEPTVQTALKDGVIHYPVPGANANPGEKGNAVFLGHSSNDVFDDGGYKFIFVQLEQMTTGDRFYINFNGTRYTYTVTGTETILPTEVAKLVTQNDKPTVTLVTCTPVGTAQKRFLVHADQISPDPDKATVATETEQANQPATITGNSPTLFDRLFGF